MTDIGYARVSTREQNPDLQHDALAKAGCPKTFTDVASGSKADRPQLAPALAYLRPGDVLVVWQLDRLGRNMRRLGSGRCQRLFDPRQHPRRTMP